MLSFFFKVKKPDRYCDDQVFCVSLARPVSSDSTKHSSRCCCEGVLWVWFTSIIRKEVEENTLNTVVASSSQMTILRAKPEVLWKMKKSSLKTEG